MNFIQRKPLIMARSISVWSLPKTYKTGRNLFLGAVGTATVLSSIVGPVVWVAIGGAASIYSWRIYHKAKSWWQYLSPKDKIMDSIVAQISSHKAIELIRTQTIQKLKSFFHDTDRGKSILKEFDLDHINQLTWEEDAHKSELIKIDDQHHRINVYFWLEDPLAGRPSSGGCEVISSAIINDKGNIESHQVKLSSPGWHEDEIITL